MLLTMGPDRLEVSVSAHFPAISQVSSALGKAVAFVGSEAPAGQGGLAKQQQQRQEAEEGSDSSHAQQKVRSASRRGPGSDGH